MADDEVKEYLEMWNLNTLIKTFEDNCITIDLFKRLTPPLIKELIPNVGQRMRFMEMYDILQITSASFDNVSETTASPSTSTNSDISKASKTELNALPAPASISYVANTTMSDQSFTNIIKDILAADIENIQPSQNLISSENALLNVLEKDTIGKYILAFYKREGKLNWDARQKLCNLVIENDLKQNFDKRIGTGRFLELRNEIVKIFPKENGETYYVTHIKNVNRNNKPATVKCAKGKLFTSYYTLRRKFKSCGLIERHLTSSSTNDTNSDESDESNTDIVEQSVLWLKSSREPWSEVEKKWADTYKHRKKNMKSIQEYFTSIPALMEPLGFILLEYDFGIMFPDHKEMIYANWPTFSNSVLNMCRSNKDKQIVALVKSMNSVENISEDTKTNYLLMMIPLLFRPISKTGAWRPSKSEVQESFILHINDISLLTSTIATKRKKLAELKQTLQPLPVIVGPSLSEIHTYIVYIDNVIYKFPTSLRCFDICFKSFYSLHAKYPIESEQVWLFMQQGLYNLYTKFDKKFTQVSTLLGELQ